MFIIKIRLNCMPLDGAHWLPDLLLMSGTDFYICKTLFLLILLEYGTEQLRFYD